jgi:hypothetical protein
MHRTLHETTEMTIKEPVLVDNEIIPVIEWLNSMHSVYTTWSCQGEDSCGQQPYVLFLCGAREEYEHVVSVIKEFEEKHPNITSLFFSKDVCLPDGISPPAELLFRDEASLQLFCEYLPTVERMKCPCSCGDQ